MLPILDKVLLDGILASQGMPTFKDRFNAEEVEEIKAYIIFTAQNLREGKSHGEVHKMTAELQKKAEQAR